MQLLRLTRDQGRDFGLVAGRSCVRESTPVCDRCLRVEFSKNLPPDPAGVVSLGVFARGHQGRERARSGGGGEIDQPRKAD